MTGPTVVAEGFIHSWFSHDWKHKSQFNASEDWGQICLGFSSHETHKHKTNMAVVTASSTCLGRHYIINSRCTTVQHGGGLNIWLMAATLTLRSCLSGCLFHPARMNKRHWQHGEYSIFNPNVTQCKQHSAYVPTGIHVTPCHHNHHELLKEIVCIHVGISV